MKYVVECMKKVKCIYIVDAENDHECHDKLVARQYERKIEIDETNKEKGFIYDGYAYKSDKKYSGVGDERIICSINDLCDYLGTTPDHLEHYMFKNTECGMPIDWDDQKVTLCVYAEGADPEWSYDLAFPFTVKDFKTTITTVEEESDQLWHEWNDDYEEE